MINLQNIHWALPENYIYFFVLLPVLAVLVYKWVASQRVVRLLSKSPQHAHFLQHASGARITIRMILWFIALFFLFVVLLRPQWNKKEETVVQESRDVFIALDISRSMLAQDLKPNRLEFAKAKIKELVNTLSCERVGLILFSGSSFVQCPLTRDYGAFFMFLDQIDAEIISSGTTALDQAIANALEAFKDIHKKNKLLVIVTDGEDFSRNLAQLKTEAQKQGITIFTLGIGTIEGAPIPVLNAAGQSIGHQKDKKGSVVISRLNEGILQTLAADVGGMYIHATPDRSDITSLIALLERIEKEKTEDKKFNVYDEQYPLFLLISFIALVIEWVL